MLKAWTDQRSGKLGRAAGNQVLSHLSDDFGAIEHIKGTIFRSPSHIIVGRVCAYDDYLQNKVAHFCNMSTTQVEANKAAAQEDRRKLVFLFITVGKTAIDYWVIPSRVVEDRLKTLTPKPNSTTCFLRVTETGGRFYLGSANITRYHGQLPIRGKSRKPKLAMAS